MFFVTLTETYEEVTGKQVTKMAGFHLNNTQTPGEKIALKMSCQAMGRQEGS